jgi:hypothetical protein
MKRVTGIGGIFFMRRTQGAGEWYKRHLGIDVQAWGGAAFDWTDDNGQPTGGTTAWCISAADSNVRARHQAVRGQLPRARPGRAAASAARRGLQCAR